MSVRPDNRLADGPMTPVQCHTCAAQVEARKSSWDQTSIQWHDDALTQCAERRSADLGDRPGAGPNAGTFGGCQALRDSIREAAVRGELPVQDEDPLKVNPEAAAHG